MYLGNRNDNSNNINIKLEPLIEILMAFIL